MKNLLDDLPRHIFRFAKKKDQKSDTSKRRTIRISLEETITVLSKQRKLNRVDWSIMVVMRCSRSWRARSRKSETLKQTNERKKKKKKEERREG